MTKTTIVKEGMAKRDLSEVPTEKLFAVQMKLTEKLKAEEIEITLREKKSLDDSLTELLEDSSYSE